MSRWMALFRAFRSPRTWHDHARDRGYVPVMDLNWERLYAIDYAGRVFSSTLDDWSTAAEENDPWTRHIVLAQAALRNPEMAWARPVRREGDADCAECGGTGARANSRQMCVCGGLGWLPHGLAPPYDPGAAD